MYEYIGWIDDGKTSTLVHIPFLRRKVVYFVCPVLNKYGKNDSIQADALLTITWVEQSLISG